MSNPKKIVIRLKEILEKNSSVASLVLVGSQARETVYKADRYSDLEAFIVVKDKTAKKLEKELPKLAKRLGKVLFSFKHDIGFVAVYDDLFRLEFPVIVYADMEKVLCRPRLQEIKVLIDKTNGYLQKVLDKRPAAIDYEELFKNKAINFWYWQIIGVQYFKKGEIYNARAILNIHASALIKLFELLNNPEIVLLEANKRVEEFLTKDQLNLLKEIIVEYDPEKIKQALIKVMDIFSDLVKQIKEKYGYDYDGTIETKTKSKLLKILTSG